MPDLDLMASPTLGGWLLTYLLHSSILLTGAWLPTRFAALGPRTQELVWKAALLASILTSSAAVLVGDRAPEMQIVTIEVERTIGALPANMGEISREIGRLRGTPDTIPTGGGIVGIRVLLGVWLAGAAFLLARLGRRAWGLRALKRTFTEPTVRARALLSTLPGAGAMRLWSSDAVASPCVLPGGEIVIAARCERELTDGELRAVLAHEAAHIRRRDPFWSALVRTVTAVLWVQPLNWVALHSARQAAELACDDQALTWTGEPHGLASSISRIAHWSFGMPTTGPVVSMTGAGGSLSDRVRRILADRPTRREPRWVTPLVLVALVVAVAWLPAVEAPRAARMTFVIERDVAHTTTAVETTGVETTSFKTTSFEMIRIDGP